MKKQERKQKLKELHVELCRMNTDSDGRHLVEALRLCEELLSGHGVFVVCFDKAHSAG